MPDRKTVLTEATGKRHKALLLAGLVILLAGFVAMVAAVTLTRSQSLQDGILACGILGAGLGALTMVVAMIVGWWRHG